MITTVADGGSLGTTTSTTRRHTRDPTHLLVSYKVDWHWMIRSYTATGNFCGTSKQPKASAQAAFAQWTKAGMPASKLLLGLPLYGYVSKSTDKKLTGSAIPAASDPRSPFVAHLHRPSVPFHAPLGDLSSLWGQQIAFSRLVSSGALRKNQDGNYDASNGYTMGMMNTLCTHCAVLTCVFC